MNIIQTLLWNIEWNNSERKQQFVLNTLRDLAPSVFCLVESTDFFLLQYPNSISSQADYGYSNPGNRRKVWLYSDESWENVEYAETSGLPSGRFVSGVTHGIRFVGICIPWSNAHVSTGHRNRKRWEDHITFLRALGPILTRYANSSLPVCVMGDFNQCSPPTKHNEHVFGDLRTAFSAGFRIATEGKMDVDGQPLIDHIATSNALDFSLTSTIGRQADQGKPVSDHSGLFGTLTRINAEPRNITIP